LGECFVGGIKLSKLLVGCKSELFRVVIKVNKWKEPKITIQVAEKEVGVGSDCKIKEYKSDLHSM
jgi:hypothetical protein